jgi:hypothetical protein
VEVRKSLFNEPWKINELPKLQKDFVSFIISHHHHLKNNTLWNNDCWMAVIMTMCNANAMWPLQKAGGIVDSEPSTHDFFGSLGSFCRVIFSSQFDKAFGIYRNPGHEPCCESLHCCIFSNSNYFMILSFFRLMFLALIKKTFIWILMRNIMRWDFLLKRRVR